MASQGLNLVVDIDKVCRRHANGSGDLRASGRGGCISGREGCSSDLFGWLSGEHIGIVNLADYPALYPNNVRRSRDLGRSAVFEPGVCESADMRIVER